jgi:hypothetical protein
MPESSRINNGLAKKNIPEFTQTAQLIWFGPTQSTTDINLEQNSD